MSSNILVHLHGDKGSALCIKIANKFGDHGCQGVGLGDLKGVGANALRLHRGEGNACHCIAFRLLVVRD